MIWESVARKLSDGQNTKKPLNPAKAVPRGQRLSRSPRAAMMTLDAATVATQGYGDGDEAAQGRPLSKLGRDLRNYI
ncbi:hypothetical protein E2C01_063142 [Portunus trituberculatus]|uniref:Uncharacterized protein n=1 Tax=Portunus trituberculatus TaxID=210409 RepID=A0A5B7H8E9_PORTR|nr:hypothetical protein [Portunus trituberculatus]